MYGSKKLQGFKKPETNVQNFTFQATTTLQGGWGLTVEKVHYQSSFRNDPDSQISIKTLVHLHLKTLVHLRTSYFSQMDSCDTNSTGIYACLHSCRSFLLTDFNILQTVLVVGSLGDRHFE